MRLIAGMVSTTPTTGKKQFEVLYRFFSMLRSEWATYGGRRWQHVVRRNHTRIRLRRKNNWVVASNGRCSYM